MGAARLGGRLTTRVLLDRFNTSRVAIAFLAAAAVGLLLLALARSMTAGVLAAALLGFGTGGEFDVVPYMLARHFGLRALSAMYGVVWMAWGAAGAVGPVLMGLAYDATGSYQGVRIGFAAVTSVVALLMLTVPAGTCSPPDS